MLPVRPSHALTARSPASHHSLEANEVEDIMTRMQESANDISRLTRELGETANDYPE